MICSPQVKTGFSDVIGSWKIIEISLPRIARISRGDRLEQVAPLEQHRSADDPPGRLGTRRRIDRAVTLLPLPDSPTTASVWPGYDVERHAVHRPHDTGVAEEVGLQVLDAQERFRAHDLPPETRRGSSASRRPSPRKLNAMTVRKMARPGT